MKKLILCSLLAAAALVAKAQGVGFVSRVIVYQSMPSFMKDLKMIDSFQASFEQDLRSESIQLQEQARAILTAYNPQEKETMADIKKRMKPADTMTLKKIMDKDANMDKKRAAYNTRIDNMQKEKINPILKRIDESIAAVANAENLDAVFFFEEVSHSLAYIKNQRDITEKVIADLKKNK
jgi:Skp family chaperone for outer membrane proteins